MTETILPGITVTAPRYGSGYDFLNYGGGSGVDNLRDHYFNEDAYLCYFTDCTGGSGLIQEPMTASESPAEVVATNDSSEDLAVILPEVAVVATKPDPRIVPLEQLLRDVPEAARPTPEPTPEPINNTARNVVNAEYRESLKWDKVRAKAAKGDTAAIRLLEKYFPFQYKSIPVQLPKPSIVSRVLAPLARVLSPVVRAISSPIVSLLWPSSLANSSLYTPAQLKQLQSQPKSSTVSQRSPSIESTALLSEVVVTGRSKQSWPESSSPKPFLLSSSVIPSVLSSSVPTFETISEPLQVYGLENSSTARQLRPAPDRRRSSRPIADVSTKSLTSPTNPSFSDPLTPSIRPSVKDIFDPLTLTPTNPSTSAQPLLSSGGCPPCGSKNKDKPKKKKQPRSECYRGTYTETAKGLIKNRKEKILCQ